jgi:hypothetical protein
LIRVPFVQIVQIGPNVLNGLNSLNVLNQSTNGLLLGLYASQRRFLRVTLP